MDAKPWLGSISRKRYTYKHILANRLTYIFNEMVNKKCHLLVKLSGDSVLRRQEVVRGPWKVAENLPANQDPIHYYRKEFPRSVEP
jgi:hypothetical protein